MKACTSLRLPHPHARNTIPELVLGKKELNFEDTFKDQFKLSLKHSWTSQPRRQMCVYGQTSLERPNYSHTTLNGLLITATEVLKNIT